jgi:hypothetical protein
LVWSSFLGGYSIPIILIVMAKKAVDKEYLENKLKTLNEQRDKVETIIEQYTEFFQRLTGAIETTTDMLNDLMKEDKVKPDESK